MTGVVSSYAHEHGGRVVLLFLLFLLAIYNFITSGYNSFAIITGKYPYIKRINNGNYVIVSKTNITFADSTLSTVINSINLK